MKIPFALLFLVTLSCFGQEKKKIDYKVYDKWKHFSAITQSQTGEWVAYQINPSLGDGYLTIENTISGQKKTIERANAAKIAFSEKFIVCKIVHPYDSVRALKLEKIDKNKFPLDTLGIYYPKDDSVRYIPSIKSFKIAEEANWIGYMSDEVALKNLKKAKRFTLFKKKKQAKQKDLTSGKTLVVLNPLTNKSDKFFGVVDFLFDKKGEKMVFIQSRKGQKDTLSASILNLNNWTITKIDDEKLILKSFNFNDEGTGLVYIGSADTNKLKNVELYSWKMGDIKSSVLIDSQMVNMPIDFTVSEFKAPTFSKDGSKIFFGTRRIVRQIPKDTLLNSEKATVDVWSWNDPLIQPQQLKLLKREKERSYLAVYHFNEKKMVQLEDSLMNHVVVRNHGNNNTGIGIINKDYQIESTWTNRGFKDIYQVNFSSGNRKLLKKRLGGFYSLSPLNDKLIWYSREDSVWMGVNLESGKELKLTDKIDANFSADNNGQPFIKVRAGSVAWAEISGKEYFVVRDNFDLWALNPLIPGDAICLTNGLGKKNSIKYTFLRLETDSVYLQFDQSILKGINDSTKSTSFWSISENDGRFSIKKLQESNHSLNYISKAKNGDKILLRRQNFQTIGELEATNLGFENVKVLSDINPQQKDYNWGTVEFTSWKAYDGEIIRGLLYKPEDFDSTKSYPLMVYFYEKYSDHINTYYVPKASHSSIQRPEYVSNGYVLFIPDIHYKSGHPAQSAYNCVVSGTDALVRRYSWIDSTRMALQGQSWGGYQTAQLVTMTNKYKAAMAGAPVTNMFSAYGGVRWGSGRSRMFQYEETQSRIGYTIWKKPELYIENSPIFGIPKVTTPLLILSNDNDGAVPWYQGIEMYMGLRRLSKPSWLLNYNGDAHNLMDLANRKDLSIRMRQFFDHYLLGTPMPRWMKYGVPAVDKGKNSGLELLENEK